MPRKASLCVPVITACCLGGRPCAPLLAQTIVLEDFESGLRIVDATGQTPETVYLWSQYPNDFSAGPDPGIATITADRAHSGTHSLQVLVTGGNVYMQFYPYSGAGWSHMHQYVMPSTAWVPDTYNALRFWVLLPPEIVAAGGGRENVQIGTYVRPPDGEARSQGTHYYHFYNFKYTGEWEQVILDSHPTYRLGGGGNTEVHDVPHPNGNASWNYIDQLTRFYFDGQGALRAVPAKFYFDDFELFTRPANENIEQVYALHAAYVHATNEIEVGWSRRKDQDSLTYEVRYAFADINSIGWRAATAAPHGKLRGDGAGPYNLMSYSTTAIRVAGHDLVYVAIKPAPATQFRQIAIPIDSIAKAAAER